MLLFSFNPQSIRPTGFQCSGTPSELARLESVKLHREFSLGRPSTMQWKCDGKDQVTLSLLLGDLKSLEEMAKTLYPC